MIFRRLSEKFTVFDGATANWNTQYKLNIPRTFHLDGILVHARWVSHGTNTGVTATDDGWRNLIRNLRFEGQEGDQASRTIVDVDGPSLIDWTRHQYGFIPYGNAKDSWLTADGSSKRVNQWYLIPFGHPVFPSPVRERLALPLPYYGSDPVLTITTGASSDIFGTAATGASGHLGIEIGVTLLQREMQNIRPNDKRLSHIQTELRSVRLGPTIAGVSPLEIPGAGLVTSMLSTGYAGNAVNSARDHVNSNPAQDNVTLEWKQRVLRRQSVASLGALSEVAAVTGASTTIFGGGTTNTAASYLGEYPTSVLFDFLADDTLTDPGALFSLMDLNPETLSGSKAYLSYGNAASGKYVQLLSHRITGRMADLMGVSML